MVALPGFNDVVSESRPQMSGALFDPTQRYRYCLWRAYDLTRPVVNFIMLNPSTADERTDDATIRRCRGFMKAWGCGGLVVTNLYALRSTDPKGLWQADDPIGPNNDAAIKRFASGGPLVVCAWGNHGAVRGRGDVVLRRLRAWGIVPYALRLTKRGQPEHPLRLPANLVPFVLES